MIYLFNDIKVDTKSFRVEQQGSPLDAQPQVIQLLSTSNFFELAVAVAISLFGLHSGAALATVVGVLVEVPVMLSLVFVVNRTRHWFAG